MTAPTRTATAPKPATPKAKENPAPKPPADAPPADAQVTVKPEAAKPAKNSAMADKEVRFNVAELLQELASKQGLTRPWVVANIDPDANGRAWNDSMVWRAFNYKIHTVEVDAMVELLRKITKKELVIDTGRARKPKLDDVKARVTEAIEVLANEAKTVAQYRKVVEAALEILRDVVPAPEAPVVDPATNEPPATNTEDTAEVKDEAKASA